MLVEVTFFPSSTLTAAFQCSNTSGLGYSWTLAGVVWGPDYPWTSQDPP